MSSDDPDTSTRVTTGRPRPPAATRPPATGRLSRGGSRGRGPEAASQARGTSHRSRTGGRWPKAVSQPPAASHQPPARLRVSVCDARGLPIRAPALSSWLARNAPASARGTITIALVSDARMRTLNRDWRRQDRATDVLSFPAEPAPDDRAAHRGAADASRRPLARRRKGRGDRDGGPVHLGDIAIATGVAARQARAARHSFDIELRVLALHGLLHLLGYDHDRDGGEMARVERRLLRQGGLGDGLIDRVV